MYRAVTRQIEVTVEPNYLPERSSAEKREYFWSYTIVITWDPLESTCRHASLSIL